MVPLSEQFSSFFLTISTGIIMGIIYDSYWLIKEHLHFRQFGTGIGDLLFWSLTTVVAFFLLLVGNWGEVRFYVFIGILLGLFLYLRLFSHAVRKIMWMVTQAIIRVLTVIFTIAFWPFRLLRRIVLVPIGYISLWQGWQRKQFIRVGQRTRWYIKNIKHRLFKAK